VQKEYAKELSMALEVLKKNRFISAFNLYRASRLVIADRYPRSVLTIVYKMGYLLYISIKEGHIYHENYH
jgi:hypothetical protein